MIRFGSETFKTLKRIDKRPLWANEGLPSNFYRLMQISLVEREREKKEQDDGIIFMNRYSITAKGKVELNEVETREAIKVHEERYFAF